MKILLVLLSITLLNLSAVAQHGLIKWDKDVKIEWPDFKGRANLHSPFAAMSAVGIYYKYNSFSNGKVYKIGFDIYSTFDRTKSWSKQKLQTKSMLTHEQLHFDIGELVSREFRKEAEHTIYTKNYRNEIAAMFNRYARSLQKLQQKYDDQTNHSKNKMKQKEWEDLVHQELLK